MRLRALELEQFRKFEQPVRLSEFGDTLNLLCGPNEFGKSTLLAAIRGLLFERHNSKADPIKRMQPWRGNAAPRLAMEFELEGGRWRIEKRFLHQPAARLTGPDGGRFDGEAAEEELQRLLGFGAPGKQGAKAEQLGVWGALWVTQRQSVEQADLSSDLARATITSCLDAEVGVLTGSERGQAVIRAARERLAALVDGYRKPKGRYKDVSATLTELDRKLGDLQDRAKRLGEDAENLRHKTALLAKEGDPAAAQRDEDAIEDARRRKEAAQLFQEQLKAADAQHEVARQGREAAERERLARTARHEAIAARQATVADAVATAGRAGSAVADAETALDLGRVALAAAQARATAAAAAERRQRDIVEVVRLAGSLASHEGVLRQAEAARNQINDLVARLAAMRISKDAVAAIRKALRERDTAQSVLHAQATSIDFDLAADAAGRVTQDGAALTPGRRTVSVVIASEIAIAGVGSIIVRPAIRDRDKLLKQAADTERRLQAALAAAWCTDFADAEGRWGEREALEAALRDAQAHLALLTPGDSASGLAPGAAALREHVDVLRRRIDQEHAKLGLAELPTLPEALAAGRAAEAEQAAAGDLLAQAHAEMTAAGTSRSQVRERLARVEAEANAARTDLDRLRAEAQAAEARESDATLAARSVEAETRQADRGARVAELKRNRPTDTPEGMQARIDRHEQAAKNRRDTIRKLQVEIAGIRARIVQEGGAGLDELIAAAERERGALAQEQAALAREVQILTMLIDTLAAAERETKQQYLAPVVRRVTPYLRSLFPGAEIACDDRLRITGLTREGLGLQEFERLSDGTQEQVSVLARLAFAEMLTDQGRPAMVILDDALAYSDGDRIERMFDILTQAASKTQILILTCREDLFVRLGGHRLELTEGAASPGV